MSFTGDRVAILKGDRSLSSLDSESVAFCNVEGGSLGRKTRRGNGIVSPDRLFAPVLSRSAYLATSTPQNRRDLGSARNEYLWRAEFFALPIVGRGRSASPSFRPIRHRIPLMDQIENGERLDLRGFADLPGWAEKEVVGFFLAGIVSI